MKLSPKPFQHSTLSYCFGFLWRETSPELENCWCLCWSLSFGCLFLPVLCNGPHVLCSLCSSSWAYSCVLVKICFKKQEMPQNLFCQWYDRVLLSFIQLYYTEPVHNLKNIVLVWTQEQTVRKKLCFTAWCGHDPLLLLLILPSADLWLISSQLKNRDFHFTSDRACFFCHCKHSYIYICSKTQPLNSPWQSPPPIPTAVAIVLILTSQFQQTQLTACRT